MLIALDTNNVSICDLQSLKKIVHKKIYDTVFVSYINKEILFNNIIIF